jgi:hypothetical protein
MAHALYIVITHPGAVSGDHLFPGACPCELGICHFSDDIEMRLDVVLPSLPLLDLLFSDPQSGIHVHRLIATKNRSAIADQN